MGGLYSTSMALAESLPNGSNGYEIVENHEEVPEPAVTIDNSLYQASVPVKNTSDSERYKAFPQLLQKVLIKISVNPKIATLPIIKSSLKDAENFIEQFSYTRTSQTERTQMRLSANFEPDKINALLVKARQPVLNTTRSLVAVWFIIHQENGANDIAGTLSENADLVKLSKSLQESAETVGLPIALPFGDLEDLSALSTNNLWTITPKQLRKVSKRYAAKAILVIKMEAGEKLCQGQPNTSTWFLLINKNQSFQWEENLSTCETVLQDGMIQTVHHLLSKNEEKSKETQPTHSQKQIIHVSVSRIHSAQDYQHVLEDLQKQPNVLDVQIEKVTPSSILYVIHIQDTLANFAESMTNSSQFQLLQKDMSKKRLEYEYLGQPSSDIWEENQ